VLRQVIPNSCRANAPDDQGTPLAWSAPLARGIPDYFASRKDRAGAGGRLHHRLPAGESDARCA